VDAPVLWVVLLLDAVLPEREEMFPQKVSGTVAYNFQPCAGAHRLPETWSMVFDKPRCLCWIQIGDLAECRVLIDSVTRPQRIPTRGLSVQREYRVCAESR
jgi:hypothetical protein